MQEKPEWKPKSACVDKIYKRRIKCVWCGVPFIDLHFNVCSVVIQTEISIDRVHHAYICSECSHYTCDVFIFIHDTLANAKHTMHQTTATAIFEHCTQQCNTHIFEQTHTHIELLSLQ